ncbi:hypothetical protein BV22DRAFT_1032418 [Leucogyrophana mollusca]|uniref:Uncharacterized protein n=1 Tax=Leucogyrophana mollusca TaxID=85980 RepID=A0ACB8BNT4_9AGAM|nr:hypothetical protein BV22DRAFT_1032418 [Leucogyrophana mollusca]
MGGLETYCKEDVNISSYSRYCVAACQRDDGSSYEDEARVTLAYNLPVDRSRYAWLRRVAQRCEANNPSR